MIRFENTVDLSQNQVVETSCWFESGQGHHRFLYPKMWLVRFAAPPLQLVGKHFKLAHRGG